MAMILWPDPTRQRLQPLCLDKGGGEAAVFLMQQPRWPQPKAKEGPQGQEGSWPPNAWPPTAPIQQTPSFLPWHTSCFSSQSSGCLLSLECLYPYLNGSLVEEPLACKFPTVPPGLPPSWSQSSDELPQACRKHGENT